MGRKKKSIVQTHYPLESPTSPVEAISPVYRPVTFTAGESDSYASIAASFLPPGYTKHEYALYLVAKNKNKPIRKGTVIEL